MKTESRKGRKRGKNRSHRRRVNATAGLVLPPGFRDIKVRLRNSQGRYLCVGMGAWAFSPDCARALIMDYLRDGVQQYIRMIAEGGGPRLKPVALDPREFLERCDRCQKPLEAMEAFFDGTVFLCPQCRARDPSHGGSHSDSKTW
jgi:hypothetical protein